MNVRYTDQLCKWRKKHTTDRPECCTEEVWNAWQIDWKSEDFAKKSAKGKANRNSERAGVGMGVSKHTCGSRSMADHERAIEREEGAPPSKIRLFEVTHSIVNEDGTRVYIDTRSTKFAEELDKKKNAILYDSDDTTPIVDSEGNPISITQEQENQIFMDASLEDLIDDKDHSHRYLYGTAGNKEKTISLRSDASTVGGRLAHEMQNELSKLNEEVVGLRQELAHRAETEGELKQMIENLNREMAERDKARDAELQEFQRMIFAQLRIPHP